VEYVDWISFSASFLLVIGLVVATLWMLKRYGRMQFQKKGGQASIHIIESQAIGARQRILLIHCDEQCFLVGSSPQGFSALGQWSQKQGVPKSSAAFSDALERIGANRGDTAE
jgi:flagellar biosynthetic protein FliO